MITVQTKNGVNLYITLTADCGENTGGYYCEVYLNEDDLGVFEFDNFVIHNDDTRTIEECCIDYAKGVDDSSLLNKEMNKNYEKFVDAYDHIQEFYQKHIIFNCEDSAIRQQFADLMETLDKAREQVHEITEHYTWD